jgi:hypothetical protein
MKLLARVFILSLCIVLLSSCSTIGNDKQDNSEKSITEGNKSNTMPSDDVSNYEGIYMYDYEYDTEDLIEDHYIVLETVDSKLQGRYYGTSDDFDVAREGYYPGFYVSNMNNLNIKDSEISFNIKLSESDMFSKPVKLEYKTSKEVPIGENSIWENSQIVDGSEKNPKHFKGKIIDREIRLQEDDGPRIFKKVK